MQQNCCCCCSWISPNIAFFSPCSSAKKNTFFFFYIGRLLPSILFSLTCPDLFCYFPFQSCSVFFPFPFFFPWCYATHCFHLPSTGCSCNLLLLLLLPSFSGLEKCKSELESLASRQDREICAPKVVLS